MTIKLNLALQGGGAHGAFTWGVLDRLLEEDGIEIAAISGTSAGALNAAAIKSGMIEGGRAGAREKLDWLWGQVGAVTAPGLSQWLSIWAPSAPWLARGMEYSSTFAAFDAMSRMMSPYAFGPLFENPLSRVVSQLSFDEVCADDGPELHICATNVRSGKIRVFTGHELSADAILASACLPTLFRAVEITDPVTGTREAYWDGGYTGNPALFPLFAPHLPDDILIVNINPIHREEIPTEPQQIQNRINEISFNSSLLRELRAIDFVQRLIAGGQVAEGQMKRVLVHMIADDALMNALSVATKLVPNPVVLARLKDAGREACGRFLETHRGDLGARSSTDLRAMFS
ncbi:MAG: patatin [Rhodobacterales bacterium]|nr:MAG: patatin [Rhodobacterales bacterium]